MELLKEIKLYFEGKQVAVPFLPFISGKTKKELTKLNVDAINKLSDEARRLVTVATNDMKDIQTPADIKIIMQEINPLFEGMIPVESIKIMVDWNKITDEHLKEAVGSPYDSDFWQEQDTKTIKETYESFRLYIAKY